MVLQEARDFTLHSSMLSCAVARNLYMNFSSRYCTVMGRTVHAVAQDVQ